MILSDIDIKGALAEKRFIIDPSPSAEDFDTTSVNLHLGEEFRTWDFSKATKAFGRGGVFVDLSSFDYRELANSYSRPIAQNSDGSIVFNPKEFILSTTKEKVGNQDPSCCLAARVEGRSSLARLGLQIHMTAPTIHAGFFGRIALELFNAGPFPLLLRPGVAICQLIVEQVSSAPQSSMAGKQFQGQDSSKGAC